MKSVGGFQHDEYRRFLTEKAVSDAHSFIDGDLIESFLDLSKQGMEEVVMLMRAEGVGGGGGRRGGGKEGGGAGRSSERKRARRDGGGG